MSRADRAARGAHAARAEHAETASRVRTWAWTRARSRGPARSHTRTRVVVVALAVVLGLGGAAAGADAALHSHFFSATEVHVTGARHESARAVERVAGLLGAPPVLGLDTAAIASRIEAAFPWVANARVSVHWPHTVDVAITERRPVAEVRTVGGKLELVDAAGRRLGAAAPDEALPVLDYAGTVAQHKTVILPAAAAPGLLVAATLPGAFRWQVAAIDVDAHGWVTLRLSSPVSFVLGPASDLLAKYHDVAAVIASATLHADDVVDVSVPQAMTVTDP